eukprot:TRINITY_DN22457_c0_g1_i1.p1 TRINITY_DN22457_c0_g1~~TRINITY_DN22457_c0_g1_i1.p1  ORF type:complete len:824 (-),score=194.15 TRINITY_DN22457_c0_g1_i1:177-2648(-)
MKFGRYLQETAVPAWRSQYIDYKKLKKIINSVRDDKDEKKLQHHRRGSDSLGSVVDGDHDLKMNAVTNGEAVAAAAVVVAEEENKLLQEKPKDEEAATAAAADSIFVHDDGPRRRWTNPNLHLDISPDLLEVFRKKHSAAQLGQQHMLRSLQLIQDPSTDEKMVVHVPHAFPHIAGPNIRFSHKNSSERVAPETYFQVQLIESIPSNVSQREFHVEFVIELQAQTRKAVRFYCEQITNFDEQVGLAVHCLREVEKIKLEPRKRERTKKMSKLPIQFQKGDRGIDQTFREIHYGLKLLESFHAMNYLAICKIVKKHDKYSQDWKGLSEIVLPLLDVFELFPDTEDLASLMRTLEKVYLDEFAGPRKMNREDALNRLRAHSAPQESAVMTFLAGCSLGGIIGVTASAFIAFAFTVSSFSSLFLEEDSGQSQLKTEIAGAIPIFRLMLLPSLTFLLWGINLLVFEKERVNVRYLMSADPKSFLRGHQVIFVSVTILVAVLVDSFVFIIVVNVSTVTYRGLLPLFLLLIMLFLLIYPAKVAYHNTRIYFWRTMRNVAITPLWDIELKHSFFADQWTSFGVVLLDIQYAFWYYLSGSFLADSQPSFIRGWLYTRLSLILALVPFWWRFAQCVRLFVLGGKDVIPHSKIPLRNSLKYFLSILAVVFAYLYRFYNAEIQWYLWLIFKIAASLFAASWDVLMDWGIFNVNISNCRIHVSKTPMHTTLKLVWSFVNLALRLAFILTFWLFTNPGSVGVSFNREFSILFLSLVEITRRGVWTTFKLQYDHDKAVKKHKAIHEIHGETMEVGDQSFLIVHRHPPSRTSSRNLTS